MITMNCTGGEPWTEPDEQEATASVRDVLKTWALDDLRGHFGWGEGAHPCPAHADGRPEDSHGDCEDCLGVEEEGLDAQVTAWVEANIDRWMAELRTNGTLEVHVGDGFDASTIRFTMKEGSN